MMKTQRETRTGWMVSLSVHGALLLLFLLISIPEVIQKQEFIEVIWGSPAVSTPSQPKQVTESIADALNPEVSVPKQTAKPEKPAQPVILPERRQSNQLEETLPIPRSEKIELSEKSGSDQRVTPGVGDRESASGKFPGERDRSGPVSGVPGSSVGQTAGSGGLGGDVDKGVSFSIQWMEGGSRRKISGELPQYPPGVNVVAQIKILTLVSPDGSVKSVQPAQKANTKLEEAAMKQVGLWKFESLRPSQPQEDQSCVVTFLFTLK